MLRTLTIVALLLSSPLTAAAQEMLPHVQHKSSDNKVFVSGRGEVTVIPDRIRVVIASEARAADRQDASARARTVADAVRSAAVGAGVPQSGLRTLRSSLGPVYDYGNGSTVPKIVGYTSSTALEVTVEDEVLAGEVIDAAISAGATGVEGPYFEVSDPQEAMNEARALAMKDAVSRARTLAEAGDFGLGEVVTVAEEDGYGPPPVPMMMKAEMSVAGDAPATRIDAGEETVSASVRVTFRITPRDLTR